MSIVYFLSIAKEFKLKKTDYKYCEIFEQYENIISSDDGIFFDNNLWDSEVEALGDIFQQRNTYSIRSTIELEFNQKQKDISQDYYIAAKKQIIWLKKFIKDTIKKFDSVFIIRLTLGNKTKFGKIKTEYIEIDNFSIPIDCFSFEPLTIYQFVDNK